MKLATVALVGLFGLASSAGAQQVSPQCPAGAPLSTQRVTQDACQKTIDIFKFTTPQLGIAIAGGNATLGQVGAMGFGHFSLGARANAFRARLPQDDEITASITGAQASDYEIDDQLFGLPMVDAAIGIFSGLPLGVTNVLAIDALVSAAYLPEVDTDNLEITVPDGSFKVGFGGRVGIVQESFVSPGVSFTYLRRPLPRVTILARSGSDSLQVQDFDIKTDSWRLVAGKSFLSFSLAAGVGRDTYDASADVRVRVNRLNISANAGPFTVDEKVTRTTYFADVALNLPVLKLIAEIGRTSGGTIETYNTFSGKRADDPILFGSIGLRLGF
jgi:hypothetical protein